MGRALRWLIGLHEGKTGSVEHAGLGVDLFAEILGLDQGMLATMAVVRFRNQPGLALFSLAV